MSNHYKHLSKEERDRLAILRGPGLTIRATAKGFDSNEAGCMGGSPPFPGQDFTAFHCGPVLDLDSGYFAAVVSIDPVPDTGPGPFQLKPLPAI